MRETITDIIMAWWDDVKDRKFSEVADIIIRVMRTRIEKVENPYYDAALIPPCEGRIGFEYCREAILKALEDDV